MTYDQKLKQERKQQRRAALLLPLQAVAGVVYIWLMVTILLI